MRKQSRESTGHYLGTNHESTLQCAGPCEDTRERHGPPQRPSIRQIKRRLVQSRHQSTIMKKMSKKMSAADTVTDGDRLADQGLRAIASRAASQQRYTMNRTTLHKRKAPKKGLVERRAIGLPNSKTPTGHHCFCLRPSGRLRFRARAPANAQKVSRCRPDRWVRLSSAPANDRAESACRSSFPQAFVRKFVLWIGLSGKRPA